MDTGGNIYIYGGGGLVSPGPSISITASPAKISRGWGITGQGGLIIGGNIEYGLNKGSWSGGAGLYTPGGSLTGIYTTGPIINITDSPDYNQNIEDIHNFGGSHE